MNQFTKFIAQRLNLHEKSVENTLALLEEGCTIPFISRYRKERTGNLDEVQIAHISDLNDRLKEMQKRKETICKTITEQEKMTPELQQRIDDCWDSTELEDIYLPFKPKRRTRAQVARERGLEPLAKIIMLQRENNPKLAAQKFVKEIYSCEPFISIKTLIIRSSFGSSRLASIRKNSALCTSTSVSATTLRSFRPIPV